MASDSAGPRTYLLACVFVSLLLFPLAVLAQDTAPVDAAIERPAGQPVEVAADSAGAENTEPGPQPAAPVFKQTGFDLGKTIGEVVLYLAILCALAAVVIVLMKRRMVASGALPEKPGTHIRVLDRKVLSSRTTVHLLEVSGQQLVVSESDGGQAMLQLVEGSAGSKQ